MTKIDYEASDDAPTIYARLEFLRVAQETLREGMDDLTKVIRESRNMHATALQRRDASAREEARLLRRLGKIKDTRLVSDEMVGIVKPEIEKLVRTLVELGIPREKIETMVLENISNATVSKGFGPPLEWTKAAVKDALDACAAS